MTIFDSLTHAEKIKRIQQEIIIMRGLLSQIDKNVKYIPDSDLTNKLLTIIQLSNDIGVLRLDIDMYARNAKNETTKR